MDQAEGMRCACNSGRATPSLRYKHSARARQTGHADGASSKVESRASIRLVTVLNSALDGQVAEPLTTAALTPTTATSMLADSTHQGAIASGGQPP
jgi:hypothetical protein